MKIKRPFFILSVIAVLLPAALVSACGNKANPSPTDLPPLSGKATYTSTKYGFSMDYPGNWDVMEATNSVVFFMKEEAVNSFHVNVTVEVATLPDETTLQGAVALFEQQRRIILPQFQKQDEYKMSVGGLPATVIVFTATLENHGVNTPIKDEMAVFNRGKSAYAIAYDAPAEFYDRYSDSFDLAAGSFRFN